MHVVVESPDFAADAKAAGPDGGDVRRLIGYLAKCPEAGDVIPGTGGARKVRFAGRGKGKSGGYRMITFCTAEQVCRCSCSRCSAKAEKSTSRGPSGTSSAGNSPVSSRTIAGE